MTAPMQPGSYYVETWTTPAGPDKLEARVWHDGACVAAIAAPTIARAAYLARLWITNNAERRDKADARLVNSFYVTPDA